MTEDKNIGDQARQIVFLVMNEMAFEKDPAIPVRGKPLEYEQVKKHLSIKIEDKATQHLIDCCKEDNKVIADCYDEYSKIKKPIKEELESFIKGLKEYEDYVLIAGK